MPSSTTSLSWLWWAVTPAPGCSRRCTRGHKKELGREQEGAWEAVEAGAAAWCGIINGAGIRIVVMKVLPTLPLLIV
ncbi:hypothetical protein M758_2G029700 [Ceratodon purpureus]|uniref:Secreted protein n=1 Tax=Ceratodon purpureus TaxID=3225 RepID=A0A8T0ITJ0_CERPU|nr:hypothetical protein KC19_2G030200 [Ceratodon purpureus]KAG0625124.1 hypothetical protein M758_2G029700 [Ceratodon purpureus]